MAKNDSYNHIEYIYPDKHLKGFWGRIVITLAIIIVEVLLFRAILKVIFTHEEGRTMIFVFWFMMTVLPLPAIWVIADTIKLFRSPVSSLKILGKVHINRDSIAILKGKHIMIKLKWEDIEVIEKSRDSGEKIITLITNKMKEKIIMCNNKKKNYIQVPARASLESAIRRFSGQEVTLANPEINRFILN